MSHWKNKMEESERKASEEWVKMKEARDNGNKRAENKAWKNHQKFKEDARRFRAMDRGPMVVKAEGFKD